MSINPMATTFTVDGKGMTRQEFYFLLRNKLQICRLAECREAYRDEYNGCEIKNRYPLYVARSGNVYAVIV